MPYAERKKRLEQKKKSLQIRKAVTQIDYIGAYNFK